VRIWFDAAAFLGLVPEGLVPKGLPQVHRKDHHQGSVPACLIIQTTLTGSLGMVY